MANHMILTFPGQNFRSTFTYNESYPILSQEIHKLYRRIAYAITRLREKKAWPYQHEFLYDYGNTLPEYEYAYIRFTRSQNNPTENNPIGYCHYHIGTNYPFNIRWLNEVIQKNNMKIGYTFITENNNFLNYLQRDFLTDEEYVIPLHARHYNTSENVHLNPSQGFLNNDGSIVFSKTENFETIDKNLWQKHNQMLPFEEYIKQFYTVTLPKPQKILSGEYVNGELKKLLPEKKR